MRLVCGPESAVPETGIDSHIGQYGLVLVTVCRLGYVGTPAFAGIGACRAGGHIVTSTKDCQEGFGWI